MTTRNQQGLHKEIQADLISFAARIMVVTHQGNAKSRVFLEPELSVGNGSCDPSEMRCKKGLDAKATWPPSSYLILSKSFNFFSHLPLL